MFTSMFLVSEIFFFILWAFKNIFSVSVLSGFDYCDRGRSPASNHSCDRRIYPLQEIQGTTQNNAPNSQRKPR